MAVERALELSDAFREIGRCTENLDGFPKLAGVLARDLADAVRGDVRLAADEVGFDVGARDDLARECGRFVAQPDRFVEECAPFDSVVGEHSPGVVAFTRPDAYRLLERAHHRFEFVGAISFRRSRELLGEFDAHELELGAPRVEQHLELGDPPVQEEGRVGLGGDGRFGCNFGRARDSTGGGAAAYSRPATGGAGVEHCHIVVPMG